MADPTPPSPDRSAALLFLAVRRGRNWESKLRVAWACAAAETPSPGPPSSTSLQFDTAPALDVTIWAHPPLAVPCPTCRARVGVRCVRPSGHQALDLHAARRVAADRAFAERYGP